MKMGSGKLDGAVKRWLLGSVLLALGGCAVASPFALQSSGSGVPTRAVVAMPIDAQEGSDRARLAAALQRAFADRSVTVASDGSLLADYAVSLTSAEAGLTTSIASTDESAIAWQASPRKSRLFDGCEPQRLRATLVLLDRASGDLVYRGEGEATDCSFSSSALDAVAEALVADALARASD